MGSMRAGSGVARPNVTLARLRPCVIIVRMIRVTWMGVMASINVGGLLVDRLRQAPGVDWCTLPDGTPLYHSAHWYDRDDL